MTNDCCQKPPWYFRQLILAIDRLFLVGTVLAILVSWEKYHSVAYSTLCAMAGWFYVIAPTILDNVWMKP